MEGFGLKEGKGKIREVGKGENKRIGIRERWKNRRGRGREGKEEGRMSEGR